MPIGVAFALALHHWRGRGSGSSNFLMMFAFVTPELILAVALFLLFINVFKVVGLGTTAQLLGLVVLAVAYPGRDRAGPAALARARRTRRLRWTSARRPVASAGRVTLPLLGPSIFASAAIVFAFALDDFVIVNQLVSRRLDPDGVDGDLRRSPDAPTPAANAIGTRSCSPRPPSLIAVAFVVYRRSARRSGTRFRAEREALPV